MNGDNFLRWSLYVQINIHDRGKLGYLNGEQIKSAKTNVFKSKYYQNSREEEFATSYLGCITTKEMLENLRQISESNTTTSSNLIAHTEQVVDCLTKGLSKNHFDRLVSKLGIEDILKPDYRNSSVDPTK
ncbi:hypothetical protein SADUNF_Sadunf17G0065000 [Salix dunnii]|uniref:Retrotransposon Copia-like N-terminal domain-containing protein n=1 Tax=Salix dunnii TaxID=1413687 RepID=A0A835J883_9ROSI|nr:hypothetical protein SADUNF_Sadunf17G0065000 [Salix dunnii]